MVACLVFSKYYKVASGIFFVYVCMERLFGDIHLAAEYWLEYFGIQLLDFFCACGYGLGIVGLGSLFEGAFGGFDLVVDFAVFLFYVIVIFLYTEHIAMVGNGQPGHSVCDSFVDQRCHGCLSVKYRILGMYVEMYEWCHLFV